MILGRDILPFDSSGQHSLDLYNSGFREFCRRHFTTLRLADDH
jgi:hypothetical protein